MKFKDYFIVESVQGVFSGFDEINVPEDMEERGIEAASIKQHKRDNTHVDKTKLPPKFPKRPYEDEKDTSPEDGNEENAEDVMSEGAFPKVGYSAKNKKLGNIMSVSLPPITTCPKDVPCKVLCYAEKVSKRYKNVLAAYTANYQQYKKDPAGYFNDIVETCNHPNGPRYFRWHVGGDIPDKSYLQGMIQVANKCKGTKFLAYTKQYAILNEVGSVPKNLSVIFSGWPGYEMDNPHAFPVAWMKPKKGEETRIPENAYLCDCSRNCDKCLKCWHWKKGANMIFEQH